jgi:hypothetical protein
MSYKQTADQQAIIDHDATKVQERMREMIKKLSLADQTSIPSDYEHVVNLAFHINPGALSSHVYGFTDTAGVMLIAYQRAIRRTVKPIINDRHDSEDDWVAGDIEGSWGSDWSG